MSITRNSFIRSTAFVAAAALLVGVSAPAFLSTQKVGAAQVQTRYIKMSDSTPGATNVKYTVGFTTATTPNQTIQGVVIDFCSKTDSPIPGEACSAPAGMNANAGPIGWTTPATGLNPTTGWTAAATANKVTFTNASGAAVNSGVAINFELTGITNPTAVGTFYARIFTFDTTTKANNYTSTVPGSYTDYGGAALSTAYNIPVTAKVMETLMFCTSDVTISDDCITLTQPSVNLGKTVGSTIVLDSASVYTDQVYAKLSTNAVGGVTVRVKTTSSTACSGLSKDNGATCAEIPAVASGATTPTAISAGTAAFGMSVTATGLTPTLPYNSGTLYGMDDSSATKAWSTYGSPLASTTGPVNGATATIKYAATASNTTPAAIYTTTQSLIATGTF